MKLQLFGSFRKLYRTILELDKFELSRNPERQTQLIDMEVWDVLVGMRYAISSYDPLERDHIAI